MIDAADSSAKAQYIVFYITAGLSLLGNLLVLISLWQIKKSKTCFTRLLYFLHGSTAMISLISFPFLYKFNSNFCIAMQSFECYFSLMNLFTIAFLLEAHRSTIIENTIDIKRMIYDYGPYFLFLFPLIAFFGFPGHAYRESSDAFCLIPTDFNRISFFSLYFIWIWLIQIFCTYRILNTLKNIYKYDKRLAKRFFSRIGLYIIISIISWLPRASIRFIEHRENNQGDDNNQYEDNIILIALFPIQLAGIIYALIYYREKNSLRQFEGAMSTERNTQEEIFSWDEVIVNESLIRLTNMTISVDVKGAVSWAFVRISGQSRTSNRTSNTEASSIQINPITRESGIHSDGREYEQE